MQLGVQLVTAAEESICAWGNLSRSGCRMAWWGRKVRWGIPTEGGFARRACKPDSVQGLPLWMIIPLPPLSPTGSSCQPGPLGLKRPCVAVSLRTSPARGPYLALLRVGLAMPSRLPGPRWALTPPFHHRPACRAVFSLWRFPWGCPRRALPGTLASWSPDFPRSRIKSEAAIIQPSAREGV